MPGPEIADYQILAKLGAGGMGVVYLAQDARLGRRVALKVLPTEFARDEDRIARFEREACAVAALSHPGIAVLYEIGEADAVRYLAMEYVEGRSLQEELAAGPLSLERLLDYSSQIADALDHAHRRGILHRDIKPASKLIPRPPPFHAPQLFFPAGVQIRVTRFGDQYPCQNRPVIIRKGRFCLTHFRLDGLIETFMFFSSTE